MKDISNGGSFLILLFTERRTERGGGGEGRRRREGALEPHFPSCSPFFVFFRPWATCCRRRQISEKKKFLEFYFCFPPINQRHHPLFLGREGEGQKGEGGKKRGETWLKERTRKRGPWRQLLERLVRDFQPLTSVVASSPTWSRQGPEQARGPIWKGTQLDLVEKLFTSGTLKSTIERSAREREREIERKDRGKKEIVYWKSETNMSKHRRKSERARRKSD